MRGRTLALGVLLAVTTVAVAAPKKRNKNKRPPDLERGRELYERHCVQCHGVDLAGDGPAAEALVAPVPDLAGLVSTEGRDALVPVVMNGRNSMPGFETSFDRYDARRVLKFIARLDKGKLPEEYELEGSKDADDADDDDAAEDDSAEDEDAR